MLELFVAVAFPLIVLLVWAVWALLPEIEVIPKSSRSAEVPM